MKPKTINTRIVSLVVLGLAAVPAMAEVVVDAAYLQDQRGMVTRSGHNLCWRTAEWTPARAIAECDPDLVAKPAPAPAPAPVAAAPAPAPAPKAAPAPAPAPVQKCKFGAALSGDTNFAFGKDELTASAKSQLDAIAKDAAGRCGSVSTVRVTGHTDRIGSASSNISLSEKRANAVAGYLKGKGLSAASYEVKGVGMSQPLPNVNCSKKLNKAKLHECLAPNRRVAVEIQGVDK